MSCKRRDTYTHTRGECVCVCVWCYGGVRSESVKSVCTFARDRCVERVREVKRVVKGQRRGENAESPVDRQAVRPELSVH